MSERTERSEAIPRRYGTSEGREAVPGVGELRAGLARIAGTVVADVDPYASVLRHARRRRRNRWGAGVGAFVAALLAASVAAPATGVGGLRTWFRDPQGGTGYPITDEWTRRLLDSPARGSLAGDRSLLGELTRTFDTDRDEAGMSATLPTVRILFADDSTGVRVVVAAYRSDRAAGLVAKTAPVGADPSELVRAGGLANLPVSPFTVLYDSLDGVRWHLGLAPAGCVVSTAPTATVAQKSQGRQNIGEAGQIQRAWRPAPTPGYLLLGEERPRGWWRVECDGKIREQGPAVLRDGELSSKLSPPGAPGTDEVRQAEQAAVRDHLLLAAAAGLPTSPPPVPRWTGRLPGDGQPASVSGPASGIGPAVLHVGAGQDTLLATATAATARPDDTGTRAASRAEWALASTAVTSSRDLTAVRVPAWSDGQAVLTDRLLVLSEATDAVQVKLIGSEDAQTTAPVTNGSAVVRLPSGAGPLTLLVLDRNDMVLAIRGVDGLAAAPQVFAEPLISDWG
ncbi:hypothetical protein [Micromonospora maritima]|uniref:hypothetical protein n=1 Tax=Micromonospora maritima TaxID=986711 RepID=UPI00157BF1B6|nr:hypothetical protein [Micromonospora maritima]